MRASMSTIALLMGTVFTTVCFAPETGAGGGHNPANASPPDEIEDDLEGEIEGEIEDDAGETVGGETVEQESAAAPAVETKVIMKQNGIKRPDVGTVTGRLWDIADRISNQLGKPAPRKAVVDEYMTAEGANAATANTQYARWVAYHGVSDMLKSHRSAETKRRQAAKDAEKAAKKGNLEQTKQAKAEEKAAEKARKAAEKEAKAKAIAHEKAEVKAAKDAETAAKAAAKAAEGAKGDDEDKAAA